MNPKSIKFFVLLSILLVLASSQCGSLGPNLVQSGFLCVPAIANCAVYSGASCAVCSSGYYISGPTSCVSAISNCGSYSYGTCTSCNSGYYLHIDSSGVAMIGTCSATASDIPNCSAFFRLKCAGCNSGYSLFNNSCIVTPISANSSSSDGSGLLSSIQGLLNLIASSCSPGFTLSSGQCVPTIPNCATYYLGYC